MSIDSDVYDTLTLAADNVYPVSVPPKALFPAVTYRRVSARRIRSHDGTSLIGPLYQFTCWDTSAIVARQTARAVVEIWEPLMAECQIENHYETYDPGQKLFGAIVDVRIWAHEEEVAS